VSITGRVNSCSVCITDNCNGVFDFIHFWSVTLVNTIKTTSFIPPSVIKLHLLFAHAFTWFTKKPKHVKACANNKCKMITVGGVNEAVLIVMEYVWMLSFNSF
jgi:hypothetical protein